MYWAAHVSQWIKLQIRPGSGKDIVEGKGSYCEEDDLVEGIYEKWRNCDRSAYIAQESSLHYPDFMWVAGKKLFGFR